MGLYEDEEQGSKSDNKRGMAIKSKVFEDSNSEEESESGDEKIAAYARRFRRFVKKNKHWKKNKNQFVKDELKKEF